ncbi:hypothetical protein [Serratia fonticola]|uniref:hypothetical protein n=1 Tax=Serratia fonticola TaxID=47917 RepID=UPI00192C7D85|nr:hypothetical protein [Serratia fonticola]MBL5902519.1 hypothetical protein [Serratia fonticola]MDK2375053.1 hypothetical protein [Serratia fonticola]
MEEILRSDFPALDRILWDYHAKKVPAALAFQMYETRWAFIDEKQLMTKKRVLIAALTDLYGNGIFMGGS